MSQKDDWVEKFREGLRRNLKRINDWNEIKLKHYDHRINLQRKTINGRTYFFYEGAVVLVHDANLH